MAEREGLHSLTLALNGDPVDPEVLDNFAFEVRSRYQKRNRPNGVPSPGHSPPERASKPERRRPSDLVSP